MRRLAKKSASLAAHRAAPPDGAATDPGRLRDWLVPWAWRPFRVTCLVLERA
jgi:hypothetical protein